MWSFIPAERPLVLAAGMFSKDLAIAPGIHLLKIPEPSGCTRVMWTLAWKSGVVLTCVHLIWDHTSSWSKWTASCYVDISHWLN
ncbi:hypothetical protein HanRHA438_Chr13g0603181 [Helianthus annuus]|nr:hypothetical protein HanRHA438_Chr13g0603181 [Helianthus annuus]